MANTSLHVKRIQQEIKELQKNPSDTFYAAPLQEDLHVWHFTIKGPPETEFEGGVYHGKFELPFDYPMKPPAIYFLTPSGRYEVNMKICLTITDYHPEQWNPGWTIKTMLKALISYFPEKENNAAVGSLDYSVDERKKLALQSRKWVCPTCGPIINLVKEDSSSPKKEEEVKEETQAEIGDKVEIVDEQEGGYEQKEHQELEEEKSPNENLNGPGIESSPSEEKKKQEYEIFQMFKKDLQKKIFERDVPYLESILWQHIEYSKAKQTIKFQKNALAVESNPPVKAKESQKVEEVQSVSAESFEDVTLHQEKNAQKEAEKQQIKKQIKSVDLLIVVLLIGIVGLYFYF